MHAFYMLLILAICFISCDHPIPKPEAKENDPADQELPIPTVDHFLTDPDQEITLKLRDQLTKQDPENAQNIKIVTHYGIVTLRGPVTSLQEKHAIERTALHIKNVKAVENFLEVRG